MLKNIEFGKLFEYLFTGTRNKIHPKPALPFVLKYKKLSLFTFHFYTYVQGLAKAIRESDTPIRKYNRNASVISSLSGVSWFDYNA